MAIQGTKNITINLDEPQSVIDLGRLAVSDADECQYNLTIKNNGEIVDCSTATNVTCLAILNPRSEKLKSVKWDGEKTSTGVRFTIPETAHEKVGPFALYVTITDSESHVLTVMYGSGFICDNSEHGLIVSIDDLITVDDLVSYLSRIEGDVTSLNSAISSANTTIASANSAIASASSFVTKMEVTSNGNIAMTVAG